MRIAIGGIDHEANTYAQGYTRLDAFAILRGEAMLPTRTMETHVGGAVRTCEVRGVTPIPLLYAQAQPSGTIERETYSHLRDELIDRLTDALPVEGVVLCLHGADVVDGIPDLEGDLCRHVRDLVGDHIPVVAVFDLHGNVTQAMADSLNGMFPCHQYPHIDFHERAREAMDLVIRQASEGWRGRCDVVRLPMLLPTTTTFEGIGAEILAEVLEREDRSGLPDLSWFHGFPHSDVPHVGSFIVATSRQGEGREQAMTVAAKLWAKREAFRVHSLDGAQSVQKAKALVVSGVEGPVVINETSNNCGGGAPGDGTHLRRAMLDAGLGTEAYFGFIVDPVTAAQAHRAGTSNVIEITLGGRTDTLHGAPIVTSVCVKSLSDGRLVLQAMMKGAPLNLGPMARLVIDGMDVVVASRRSQTFDPEPFLALGIDVRRYRYVALKSSNLFRAGFREIAGAIVTADTPGLVTQNIAVFPRQSTREPLWPLDARALFKEGNPV